MEAIAELLKDGTEVRHEISIDIKTGFVLLMLILAYKFL